MAKIDKAVEERAKFEIRQRETKGDEEGMEELSNYWLKFDMEQAKKE